MEIDSKSSLLNLYEAIQDAVDFDRDHLFEFFVGRHHRNHKVVLENSCDWEASFDIYNSIILERLYPLPKNCELYYDFGDDRYFEIKMTRNKPREPETGVVCPRIIKSVCQNPPQYGYEWDEDFEIGDTESE
jgi:hypothetical protein